MHGPAPHNPLAQAAREMSAAAREAKSPLFERVAIFTMIGSALTTTALAALQAIHMIRRDLKEDRREKERERRAAAALPPERPEHDAPADTGDGARRWSSREERAHAASHARGR